MVSAGRNARVRSPHAGQTASRPGSTTVLDRIAHVDIVDRGAYPSTPGLQRASPEVLSHPLNEIIPGIPDSPRDRGRATSSTRRHRLLDGGHCRQPTPPSCAGDVSAEPTACSSSAPTMRLMSAIKASTGRALVRSSSASSNRMPNRFGTNVVRDFHRDASAPRSQRAGGVALTISPRWRPCLSPGMHHHEPMRTSARWTTRLGLRLDRCHHGKNLTAQCEHTLVVTPTTAQYLRRCDISVSLLVAGNPTSDAGKSDGRRRVLCLCWRSKGLGVAPSQGRRTCPTVAVTTAGGRSVGPRPVRPAPRSGAPSGSIRSC